MEFKFYRPKVICLAITRGSAVSYERRRVSEIINDVPYTALFSSALGCFDRGPRKVIFLWGEQTTDQTIEVLTHESIHWALHKVEGARASKGFDKIRSFVETEWPKEDEQNLFKPVEASILTTRSK